MATASPDDASMYKIMAVDRSTEKWVTLSDWSTTKSVTYTPVNPGTHRVVVYVKHKSVSGDVYSDYRYVDINIKPAKSSVTSLEVLGKVALGETVTIKAAATPSENTLYKIMAVDRSTEEWVTLSNWSTRNQATYTFKNNAQYRFVVYVKHSSKNQDTEDDYRYVDVSTLRGTIVIDPGHGGSDPGAIGNGFLEKNGTLDISFKLKSKLENLGYKVYVTRSDDSYVDLYDRARLANNVKADLLVSIHHNAFSETSTGIEVLYSARDMDRNIRNEAINIGWTDPDITYAARVSTSSTIAKDLSANLASALGMVNRGAKEQNLAVCRNTAMPSILVEAGFITNPNDCSIVMSSFGQDLITTTIANVISKYIK